MDDLREVIARAIAKADRVEICSDASYRHSAYGGKADAALAAIKQAGFVVVKDNEDSNQHREGRKHGEA